MCRILVHIHVGSVITVEAIDRNRVTPFARMLARSIERQALPDYRVIGLLT